MRRRSVLVLVLVLALSLVMVGAVNAKPPSFGDRTGDLDLSLNYGAIPPSIPHDGIVWYGTVEFDGIEYGIVYRTVTTHASEVVSHWTETWEMYAPGTYEFFSAGGVLTNFVTTADPLVVGRDEGITHWKKFTWLGNGPITDATGVFDHWEGRRTHTKGVFNPLEGWGIGTLRIN